MMSYVRVTASAEMVAHVLSKGSSPIYFAGTIKPRMPGRYQRLSAIGIRVDRWDGRVWRRIGYGDGGVVCANQELPWREAR